MVLRFGERIRPKQAAQAFVACWQHAGGKVANVQRSKGFGIEALHAGIIAAGAALLLTYLLLPGFLIGVGAVAVLAGAWVIAWTINGERYVNRYIEEEITVSRPEPKPTATE